MISSNYNVNFGGMWEILPAIRKEAGVFKRGTKEYYTVHPRIYHPFKNETDEFASSVANRNTFGRVFSLKSHHDGTIDDSTIFQMNFVKVGSRISENDAEQLANTGYKREFVSGISDDKSFWSIYQNAIYMPYDVKRLDADYVTDFVGRKFSSEI